MEETCSDMGLSMTTAFTIFAKKVAREKRIPFEVSADSFYSASNIRAMDDFYLKSMERIPLLANSRQENAEAYQCFAERHG